MAARTLIIAEAGVNHDGELTKALALVDAAATAGADVVKFQTFSPAALASRHARQADYQVRNIGKSESQRAMLERLTLSPEAHREILARCKIKGIQFLSTPFDCDSLTFLTMGLGVSRLKIGSGDATNAPLLLSAAQTGRPIILSTGMTTLGEVEEALGALALGYLGYRAPTSRAELTGAFRAAGAAAILREKVTLLHCTSDYPAAPRDINLAAMETLKAAFGLSVGYSDHTLGIAIAIAAVAQGAAVIEKHLTLDRAAPGPDHAASLEPEAFAAMVAAIRDVEEAQGDGRKVPQPGERPTMAVARKSLVAARPIAAGERFTAENVAVKRPGDGLSPFDYWDILGTVAPRAFDTDELLER